MFGRGDRPGGGLVGEARWPDDREVQVAGGEPLPFAARDGDHHHQPVQERHPHRGRRDDLPDHGVPAREARQGRRVRAHEAAPRRRRRRDRQDLPRRREVPPGAHRDDARCSTSTTPATRRSSWTPATTSRSSCHATSPARRCVGAAQRRGRGAVRRRAPDRRPGRERRRPGGRPRPTRASRATPPPAAAPSRRRSRPASTVEVPLFIDEGERSASTPARGEYVSRA